MSGASSSHGQNHLLHHGVEINAPERKTLDVTLENWLASMPIYLLVEKLGGGEMLSSYIHLVFFWHIGTTTLPYASRPPFSKERTRSPNRLLNNNNNNNNVLAAGAAAAAAND